MRRVVFHGVTHVMVVMMVHHHHHVVMVMMVMHHRSRSHGVGCGSGRWGSVISESQCGREDERGGEAERGSNLQHCFLHVLNRGINLLTTSDGTLT
jgi:hypothetical protein